MDTFFRVAIVALFFATTIFADEEIPVPSVTRIDYAHPEKYLTLHPSMGSESRIRDVADKLKAKSADKTLRSINDWIAGSLKYDSKAAYSWRDFDTAVDARCYGGCADYAVVFASLSRACDIPTVFAKTLDVAWIYNYRLSGTEDSWSGHVFLEVFIDGRWRLLDPEACILYDDYDPASRILPGMRYAYDKGSDPRALPLSTDWERWKRQTATHFSKFDLAELFNPKTMPAVQAGHSLPSPNHVYIAANSPIWQALSVRCQALHYRVKRSFNTNFDDCLRMAKGSRLIITCVGDQIVLPRERYAEFLPLAADDVFKRTAAGDKGVASRELANGTSVNLIYAKDEATMLELVKAFKIPGDK